MRGVKMFTYLYPKQANNIGKSEFGYALVDVHLCELDQIEQEL